ncbi:MAG TPA: hypothetical protein PLL72_00705 [Burkholderiaceae bacterium]|nr:hypothetical protein [Burkholderiaceae bacterium]
MTARLTTTRRATALNLILGSLALAAAALAPAAQAGELDAAPTGLSVASREQVRAEWLAAQRAGDLVVSAETGQTARDLAPQRYPHAPEVAVKTRRDVRAETINAIRSGDVIDTETGLKLNQLYPTRYQHAQPAQAKGQIAAAPSLNSTY